MDDEEWSLQTQEMELSTSMLTRGGWGMKLLKQKRFQERTASKWQGLCTLKWLQNRAHTGIVGKTVTCRLINKMSDFFLANSLTCNRGVMGPSHCVCFPFAFSLACFKALLEEMGTPPKYMFNVFQRHARFHSCCFSLLPNLLLTTTVLPRSFPKL